MPPRPPSRERTLRVRDRARSGAPAGPGSDSALAVSGRTLLDLAREDFSDPRSLAEAKQLMRTLIGHYTGGKTLASRRIFRELQEL
jgi:DNA repair protein RecO (recombination protein O)